MATVNLSSIITPANVLTASNAETLTNKTISGANNTLTNVPLTTGVTGTLPIGNGGTGTTSTTFANLTTNVTGTLPVANGGTSLSTLTANNVVIGNGTSAPLFVAPGANGNVLTASGGTWTSTAPASSGALAAKTCTFNASGTWTKPSGYGTTAQVYIQAWGGGASGAKTAFSGAGGGGGGAYNYRWISIACLASTVTVTIGAGGAARTACTCGAVGGVTTFGSHVSAYGGGSGLSCGANFGNGGGGGGQLSGGSTGPAPGAPVDNQPFYVAAISEWVVFEGAGALYNAVNAVFTRATAGNFKGGGGGASSTSNAHRNGAASVWGGGGGGGARSTCGAGSGGTSSYGGNGGAAAQSGSAVSGVQPAGGGGAASFNATSSGAGGAGRIVVTVYAGV